MWGQGEFILLWAARVCESSNARAGALLRLYSAFRSPAAAQAHHRLQGVPQPLVSDATYPCKGLQTHLCITQADPNISADCVMDVLAAVEQAPRPARARTLLRRDATPRQAPVIRGVRVYLRRSPGPESHRGVGRHFTVYRQGNQGLRLRQAPVQCHMLHTACAAPCL